MIVGTVNGQNEIGFEIPIHDSQGNEYQIETILDTGFNGSLTLPPAVISHLGLPLRSQASALLADGTVDRFDLHSATVIWDGTPRSILVEAIDTTPLLGMALLAGFDLQARVVAGGHAQITSVP